MKPFLLLLLFCNLVFLMWELGPREQDRRAQKALLEQRLSEAPGIELLKPASQKVISPVAETPVVPVPPSKPQPEPEPVVDSQSVESTAPVRCYDYGAFVTWDEAKAFTLQLPEGWVLGKIHAQDVWIDQGYWVMIPAPNSMAAARENVEQVKAKGVTDYWLVPTGRDRGIISLGLFNTIERAETQRRELLGKGIDAQIDKKRALRSRYRVGIQTSSEPVSTLQTLGITLNPSLLEPHVSCPN